MSIQIDLTSGNSAQLGPNGYEYDRIARVSGLSTMLDNAAKFHAAMQALAIQAGITIGSPHPTIPTARLRDVRMISADGASVRLELHYVDADEGPRMSLSSAPQDVETNMGYLVTESEIGKVQSRATSKTAMCVQHTYPSDWPVEQYAGRTIKTGVTANRLKPCPTMTIRKREYGKTYEDYLLLMTRFVGRVNKTTWNVAPQADAYTWLCTGIEVEAVDHRRKYDSWVRPDEPGTWDVTYTFQYQGGDKWDKRFVFLDPETGRPIDPDETDDDGVNVEVKRYQIYDAADFNELGLTSQ